MQNADETLIKYSFLKEETQEFCGELCNMKAFSNLLQWDTRLLVHMDVVYG